MENNYIGAATSTRLIKLFEEMREETLILKPSFQRKLVWNDRHKEDFIETILLGYPFPEIYLCNGEVDLETQKSTRIVVDGQQRLEAIYSYVTGKLKCKHISLFNDLSNKEQKEFFNYLVVVRDLGDIGEKQIKEIFKRINSVQYALKAIEIRNALYEGDFIAVAKEVVNHEALNKLKVFSEIQLSRMKDIDLILIIMTTIEVNGYFTRDDEVAEIIYRYDNKYPNKSAMKRKLTRVFTVLSGLNLPPDSIWFRLSNFFTLTVELYKYGEEFDRLPPRAILIKKLHSLENLLIKNKNKDAEKNEFARYYKYIYQATSSKAARIFRGQIVANYLRKKV